MEAVVAAFVNNRALRRALGFSPDRCLSLRIPPCRLVVDKAFQHRLAQLCEARLRKHPLVTTNSGVSVSLKFWWRFERLTMKVCTPTNQERYHYMYRFTGEYVFIEST
jgi:hypothetical protein